MSPSLSSPIDLSADTEDHEQCVVREFLEFFSRAPGYFVDVGANHPTDGSLSWQLERRGWKGVLVEPIPELAARLRETRKAQVFGVACSSPVNAGKSLPFHVADNAAGSSLDRSRMAPWAKVKVTVDIPVRTLDSLLVEAGAPRPIDFLSVDVEGHETEVLSGFDFDRWNPRLILVEDHVGNLRRHRLMRSRGYRLVRRVGLNGWYVPENSPVWFGFAEEFRLLRKYYLGLPFRKARNKARNFIRGGAATDWATV
jgi:FkbM family methyltransferase